MNAKAQSSIEYLVAVGGIVVVAAIILALIMGVPSSVPAPECNVECGNLPLTEIGREETCNNHVMENPQICGGSCLWVENQCIYIP